MGPLALAAISWPGSLLLEGVNKQILGRLLVGSMKKREESSCGNMLGNQNKKDS